MIGGGKMLLSQGTANKSDKVLDIHLKNARYSIDQVMAQSIVVSNL